VTRAHSLTRTRFEHHPTVAQHHAPQAELEHFNTAFIDRLVHNTAINSAKIRIKAQQGSKILHGLKRCVLCLPYAGAALLSLLPCPAFEHQGGSWRLSICNLNLKSTVSLLDKGLAIRSLLHVLFFRFSLVIGRHDALIVND